MTKPPRRRGSWIAGWLVSLVLAGVMDRASLAQAEPAGPSRPAVPVVVAVDTSRSLSPAELARAAESLRAWLAALPADTPSALLAFDDEPRWLRRLGASPAEVAEALAELAPSGNFTLLHDALFVAVRELADGGVILLATDGRDENSATTVEDIARRCEAQSVRIVSLGSGRRVEERSLRRLALLSNGAYLGEVGGVGQASVGEAVAEARREVRAERVAPAASPPPAAPLNEPSAAVAAAAGSTSPAATPPPASAAVGGGVPRSLLLIGGLILGVLALVALALWWKRRPARPSYCPDCGSELEDGEPDCAQCRAIRLRRSLAQRGVASLQQAPEVTVDTAVFYQMNLDERLEKTRVLSNQSVLLVRKPGEAPRSFLLGLGDGEAFAVGREQEGNTLAIPDPSLSARHLKIVPEGDKFYVVDLESTNGCFVNGVRTSVQELRSGDVIRAGQVELEYQSHADY